MIEKHLKKTFHLSHLIEIAAADNELKVVVKKSCKWNFSIWEQWIDDIKLECEKWQRCSNIKLFIFI